MEFFYSIKENKSAEIAEKKSKFIADLFCVEKVEDVEKILEEVKKKYYDARHHCFAYRIQENNMLIEKCSDDGEPTGTAGTPMLNILKGRELINVLVIVTRYFGGTLLGTGGLVRAYSDSTIKVLEEAEVVKRAFGIEAKVVIPYTDLEKFKYYIKKIEGKITNILYLDNIELTIEILKRYEEDITKNYGNVSVTILKCKIMEEKFVGISIDSGET